MSLFSSCKPAERAMSWIWIWEYRRYYISARVCQIRAPIIIIGNNLLFCLFLCYSLYVRYFTRWPHGRVSPIVTKNHAFLARHEKVAHYISSGRMHELILLSKLRAAEMVYRIARRISASVNMCINIKPCSRAFRTCSRSVLSAGGISFTKSFTRVFGSSMMLQIKMNNNVLLFLLSLCRLLLDSVFAQSIIFTTTTPAASMYIILKL